MKKFLDWGALAADYASYHTSAGNRACHMVGVPMIVFCVVDWTLVGGSSVPLAALVLPLYALWDGLLAVVMTGLIFAMGAAAHYVPAPVTWGLFVVGWVFQFVGHGLYEKRSPAFQRNLIHLLVGPMWVLREALALPGGSKK